MGWLRKVAQPDTAPDPLNWHKLELRNSGVTGSVATRIELKKYSAAEVRSTLVDAPQPMSQRQAGTCILVLEGQYNSIRLLLGAEDRAPVASLVQRE